MLCFSIHKCLFLCLRFFIIILFSFNYMLSKSSQMIRYISQSWTLAKIAPLNWAFHECKNTTFSQDFQIICNLLSFCEENPKVLKCPKIVKSLIRNEITDSRFFANVFQYAVFQNVKERRVCTLLYIDT